CAASQTRLRRTRLGTAYDPGQAGFHQLMVIGRSRSYGSTPENRRRRIFSPAGGGAKRQGTRY
ncbi:MAG: hypothetical protein ACYCYO_22030, partial [Bacilli bacterium]